MQKMEIKQKTQLVSPISRQKANVYSLTLVLPSPNFENHDLNLEIPGHFGLNPSNTI